MSVWLPITVVPKAPSILTFLVEVAEGGSRGLEVGVDSACGRDPQTSFREYFDPRLSTQDRGWQERSLRLPPDLKPGGWIILRVIPVGGGEPTQAQVGWAKLLIQPLEPQ